MFAVRCVKKTIGPPINIEKIDGNSFARAYIGAAGSVSAAKHKNRENMLSGVNFMLLL